MKITRRQFGLTMIGGIFALIFGRISGIFGRSGPHVPTDYKRARYWSSGDRLAG